MIIALMYICVLDNRLARRGEFIGGDGGPHCIWYECLDVGFWSVLLLWCQIVYDMSVGEMQIYMQSY